jgi:hypothetical protein
MPSRRHESTGNVNGANPHQENKMIQSVTRILNQEQLAELEELKDSHKSGRDRRGMRDMDCSEFE